MIDLIEQPRLHNKLLAGLRPEWFAALAPHLTQLSLEANAVVETPGTAIAEVCFPGPGLISIVSGTPGGTRGETGLIGPEGMTGVSLLYGVDRTPHEAFVQIPCRVLRIATAEFREAVDGDRALHDHLLRYAYAFSIQVTQTALCNGRFGLEQRLARWLLMCHDRVDREDLVLTHQFLSLMLGVRRAGVTTSLNELVTLRAIALRRGTVVIRDRTLLLERAGEAYGLAEAQYAAIMAVGPGERAS